MVLRCSGAGAGGLCVGGFVGGDVEGGLDTRLPAVGAHEEGLVLVEGENAVLLPGLPHAFALRDDRRRGLVGIEHVESDLAGAGDDGVHSVGKAAKHPRDV
eukprot:scaffold17201_cov75-Phaeocystis_antarctica.AAC.1